MSTVVVYSVNQTVAINTRVDEMSYYEVSIYCLWCR